MATEEAMQPPVMSDLPGADETQETDGGSAAEVPTDSEELRSGNEACSETAAAEPQCACSNTEPGEPGDSCVTSKNEASGDEQSDEPSSEHSENQYEAIEQSDAGLDAAAAIAANLAPLLSGIEAGLGRFNDRFAAYEQRTQDLHSRVEELQQDQVRQLLKPAFERLATLHAEALRTSEAKAVSDPSTAEDFSFFATSIEEMMALYDLDPVGAAVDGAFDARIHHAQRAIPTADETQGGTIQRVIRQGFSFAGAARVFLPARVSVYKYVPAADPVPVAEVSDAAQSETSDSVNGSETTADAATPTAGEHTSTANESAPAHN